MRSPQHRRPAMGIPNAPQWEDPDHAVDDRTINTGVRKNNNPHSNKPL